MATVTDSFNRTRTEAEAARKKCWSGLVRLAPGDSGLVRQSLGKRMFRLLASSRFPLAILMIMIPEHLGKKRIMGLETNDGFVSVSVRRGAPRFDL